MVDFDCKMGKSSNQGQLGWVLNYDDNYHDNYDHNYDVEYDGPVTITQCIGNRKGVGALVARTGRLCCSCCSKTM